MNNKNIAKSPLRIAFFGTPSFAEMILRGLLKSPFSPVLVVSKPDAPVGRKKILTKSPVKLLALEYALPVLTPKKIDKAFLDTFSSYHIDLAIVAAYGKVFPKTLLDIPPLGCINVHASLLPDYRGASPIQSALLDGKAKTGITLMRMSEGLDTGNILATASLPIDIDDTTQTLTEKLSHKADDFLLKNLSQWQEKIPKGTPQQTTHAQPCTLIRKEDGHLDWKQSQDILYNTYRALTPWPGVYSFLEKNGKQIRIKWLHIRPGKKTYPNKQPGTLILNEDTSLSLVTGDHKEISIHTLQIEGKNPISANSFFQGYSQFDHSIVS